MRLRRALGLFLCAASASDVEHVLLVVVDDLGHSDLGFTGSEIRTLASAIVAGSAHFSAPWNWPQSSAETL